MRQYSLPRARIIRGREAFYKLYKEGHRVYTAYTYMIFTYDGSRFCINPVLNYKVAFRIPKSLGNAVKRNHIRRWAKEQFRYQQHQLCQYLSLRCVSVAMIFHFHTLVNSYQEVSQSLTTLIDKMNILMWNEL